LFTDQKEPTELLAGWPAERLVATRNSLPGVTPGKALKDPKTAASNIWERAEKLGQIVAPEPVAAKPETAPLKAKAAQKGKAGAQAAKAAPVKGKATKKATLAKAAPKAKKAAKPKDGGAPREGSKMAQAVAMLSRKNGATLNELAEKFSWKVWSVRGFIAGALKKAGYTVESFKSDKGERTYRLCGAPHKR
jgi:hypothetical protein